MVYVRTMIWTALCLALVAVANRDLLAPATCAADGATACPNPQPSCLSDPANVVVDEASNRVCIKPACWKASGASVSYLYAYDCDLGLCLTPKYSNVPPTQALCFKFDEVFGTKCKGKVCVMEHDGELKLASPNTIIPDKCVSTPNQKCKSCIFEIEVTRTSGSCEDPYKCTTGDVCTADGECEGTPVVCASDDNDCTDEACDEDDGLCKSTPNDSNTCSDDKECTVEDHCKSGECVGTEFCDDGNPCTDDSCNPDTGKCQNIFDKYNDCSDRDDCTTDDKCVAGECQGTPDPECSPPECKDEGEPCVPGDTNPCCDTPDKLLCIKKEGDATYTCQPTDVDSLCSNPRLPGACVDDCPERGDKCNECSSDCGNNCAVLCKAICGSTSRGPQVGEL